MDAEKPKIVCFVCDWVSTEEELGISKTRRSAYNVNIIRIPCLGRLDPVALLEILQKGIDGVLMVGCASPDCHFIDGNVQAEQTISVMKKLLRLAQLEPERLALHLLAPSEEVQLGRIVRTFARDLRKLGSSPLKPEKRNSSVYQNISAAKSAVSGFHLRAWIAKTRRLTDSPNVYREMISSEELVSLADKAIEAEFLRHRILLATSGKPSSVTELSKELGLKPAVALRHVLNLRQNGRLVLDRVEGTTLFYKALEAR